MSDSSKDIVLDTINQAKDDIKTFRQQIEENSVKFSKIKGALRELQNIGQLLNDLQKTCNDEEKALNELNKKLNKIQKQKLYSKTDIMLDTIDLNLPKDMKLGKKTIKKVDSDSNFITREILNNNESVGKIEVLEYTDSGLEIKVNIKDKVDKFYIDEPLLIYDIISFILTKFNY